MSMVQLARPARGLGLVLLTAVLLPAPGAVASPDLPAGERNEKAGTVLFKGTFDIVDPPDPYNEIPEGDYVYDRIVAIVVRLDRRLPGRGSNVRRDENGWGWAIGCPIPQFRNATDEVIEKYKRSGTLLFDVERPASSVEYDLTFKAKSYDARVCAMAYNRSGEPRLWSGAHWFAGTNGHPQYDRPIRVFTTVDMKAKVSGGLLKVTGAVEALDWEGGKVRSGSPAVAIERKSGRGWKTIKTVTARSLRFSTSIPKLTGQIRASVIPHPGKLRPKTIGFAASSSKPVRIR